MADSTTDQVGNDNEPTVVGSALDPAHFNTVLLIQLNRIYDVAMAFLGTINPEKAAELFNLHEQGGYLAPDPAIIVPAES